MLLQKKHIQLSHHDVPLSQVVVSRGGNVGTEGLQRADTVAVLVVLAAVELGES